MSLTTIFVNSHNLACATFKRCSYGAGDMFGGAPERIVIKMCITLRCAGLRVAQ